MLLLKDSEISRPRNEDLEKMKLTGQLESQRDRVKQHTSSLVSLSKWMVGQGLGERKKTVFINMKEMNA